MRAGEVEFLLEPMDDRIIPLLQQLYPDGEYQNHQDRYNRTLFLTYRIPRAALDAARGLKATYSPDTDATSDGATYRASPHP